jgi:chromosome segregation ATPase
MTTKVKDRQQTTTATYTKSHPNNSWGDEQIILDTEISILKGDLESARTTLQHCDRSLEVLNQLIAELPAGALIDRREATYKLDRATELRAKAESRFARLEARMTRCREKVMLFPTHLLRAEQKLGRLQQASRV